MWTSNNVLCTVECTMCTMVVQAIMVTRSMRRSMRVLIPQRPSRRRHLRTSDSPSNMIRSFVIKPAPRWAVTYVFCAIALTSAQATDAVADGSTSALAVGSPVFSGGPIVGKDQRGKRNCTAIASLRRCAGSLQSSQSQLGLSGGVQKNVQLVHVLQS